MANTYTAIMKQDGDWWIGWIEEVCTDLKRLFPQAMLDRHTGRTPSRLKSFDGAPAIGNSFSRPERFQP
jgi:hypothetical protein